MSRPSQILLSEIRIDGDTQPRAAINDAVVVEYRDALDAGAKLPPAIVYYDSTAYWLAAGFHRYHAYTMAGYERMPCEVRRGTRDEAAWFAVSTNQTHGLRRSNEDKAKAVKMALAHPNGVGMSDRAIAEHVGVDHKTVARCRREMESTGEVPQSTKRTGRDGRTIETGAIGSTAEIPQSTTPDECNYEIDDESEEPEAPRLDPNGFPWSDSAYGDVLEFGAFRTYAAELRDIAKQVKRSNDTNYLTTKFDFSALVASLRAAARILESAAPYAMCDCTGPGCERCQQSGWLTKAQYDLPQEPEVVDPAIPEELNTPAFLGAWDEWEKYRKERRKTLTKTTRKRQLKMLASWGPAKAVEAIEASITNGWVGLFDPDTKRGKKPGAGQRHPNDAGDADGQF